MVPTSNLKTEEAPKRDRVWTTRANWKDKTNPVPSRVHEYGWTFSRAEIASPILSRFLPHTAPGLAALPKGNLIVRDGLIPLLGFFSRFPIPPKGFAPTLLIWHEHEAFIPNRWRKCCRTYSVGSRPDTDLFARVLPVSERSRWVFAFHFSSEYCTKEFLQQRLKTLRSMRSLRKVHTSKEESIGFMAQGWQSLEHQQQMHWELNSFLNREPASIEYYELKHFLDLRKSLILDLNERLMCADDANVHLMLARGAVSPFEDVGEKGTFVRLSPFHGYFLGSLRAPTSDFWGDAGAGVFKDLLESLQMEMRVPAGMGSVEPWIWTMVNAGFHRKYLR